MAHVLRKGAGLGLLASLCLAPAAIAATPTDSTALRTAVSEAGIATHLATFQSIAEANDGHRASGSSGYDESADYVAEKLKAAGYQVRRQFFTFPSFSELAETKFARLSPNPRTYGPDDFSIMEYSGSGDVTGAVVPTNDIQVPPGAEPSSSNSGCEPTDFAPASATADQVALVQRGTCTFSVKASNAEAAGYDAVVIFNEGQAGRTEVLSGTLGGVGFGIPVIGASYAAGAELFELTKGAEPVVVSVFTSTLSENKETSNVIADSPTGRGDRVVVAGSHLDSVAEGPGINDNGSGAASNLEIALQMATTNLRNKVRFAFWGAEESGLLGAQYYVDQLSARERKNIAVNLNYDMVGSTNYVRFVYDGDGSDTPDAGPNGSGTIEDVFNDFFASQGLATAPTAFDGRSDYGPFIDAGIPAGGLFSGAEGIKTVQEAAVFGGEAGKPYDACYHLGCDDLDNVSPKALAEFSDAAAHATLTFAQTTSAVNGTDNGSSTSTVGDFQYRGSRLRK